jgi:hypothetical protein
MMTDTPTPEVEHRRSPLYAIGLVLLVAGLLGVAAWGLQAWFAAGMGATGDRVMCEMVGVEDPVNQPEVWSCLTGPDHAPTVLFSGTEDVVDTVIGMSQEIYLADQRVAWLYPAVGTVIVGLGLMVVGLRRELAR